MWQGNPQGFGDHLGGGGSAKELTATAGGATGPAAEGGGLLERQFALGEARSDGLHFAGVFAISRGQRDATRYEDCGQVGCASQGDE